MKLLYIEGQSLQNVADIMDIAKPTAQDLQRRAMSHVRKKLGA
jgi:DNA-directed RNA polymerase specialized sigma24 family protein